LDPWVKLFNGADSGIDLCSLPEPCFGPHDDCLSKIKGESNFLPNVHKSKVNCNHKEDPQWGANYNTLTGFYFWIGDIVNNQPETLREKNQFKAT